MFVKPSISLRLVPLVAVVSSLVSSVSEASAQLRGSPEGEVFKFEIASKMPSPEWEVFVSGDLEALGNEEIIRSVKLISEDGLHWRLAIELPPNRKFRYQYYRRLSEAVQIGRESNGVPIGGPIEASTPPSFVERRTFRCYSTHVSPRLHWRERPGGYAISSLSYAGAGRTPEESLWELVGFGERTRQVEFFLTEEDGTGRDPVFGTYKTRIGEIFLQDGALYNYIPAPVVSPMRKDYQRPPMIYSNVLGQFRTYRVMLPRGYDEHGDRDYSVLYHYDGQVIWDAAAQSWDRNGQNMAALVNGGQVGELIQVGIDFISGTSCETTTNRGRDCLSPEDKLTLDPCETFVGEADRFLRFLLTELKPLIDSTYRTRPEREHTFLTGYSFGGVLSLYAGWMFSDWFSAVACQSGSFWVPNFPARVGAEPKRPIRIYMDAGSHGSKGDPIYETNLRLRDVLLLKPIPYIEEHDLRFRVGYDHYHSYEQGGLRIEEMMTFLYPAR